VIAMVDSRVNEGELPKCQDWNPAPGRRVTFPYGREAGCDMGQLFLSAPEK